MEWWSPLDPERKRSSKAVFVAYDSGGFPDEDAFLAIPIGKFKQVFRWPLKYMRPLVE